MQFAVNPPGRGRPTAYEAAGKTQLYNMSQLPPSPPPPLEEVVASPTAAAKEKETPEYLSFKNRPFDISIDRGVNDGKTTVAVCF
jgi:hypothetical protein